MACFKLHAAHLDTELVKARVLGKYATATAFFEATCLCKQTYHRWVAGRNQPPLGFYFLLAAEFGGDPMDYAIKD